MLMPRKISALRSITRTAESRLTESFIRTQTSASQPVPCAMENGFVRVSLLWTYLCGIVRAIMRPDCCSRFQNHRMSNRVVLIKQWKASSVACFNTPVRLFLSVSFRGCVRSGRASTTQACNQLGTPWGAKSFLRGAQVFWTMSNSFKRGPTHFSRGANIFLGGLGPPWLGTCYSLSPLSECSCLDWNTFTVLFCKTAPINFNSGSRKGFNKPGRW